jgi:hypothetical protein
MKQKFLKIISQHGYTNTQMQHRNAHNLHSKIGHVFHGFKLAFQPSMANSSGEGRPMLGRTHTQLHVQ